MIFLEIDLLRRITKIQICYHGNLETPVFPTSPSIGELVMSQDLNITEDVKLLMRADLKRKSESVILSVFFPLQIKEVKWKSFT